MASNSRLAAPSGRRTLVAGPRTAKQAAPPRCEQTGRAALHSRVTIRLASGLTTEPACPSPSMSRVHPARDNTGFPAQTATRDGTGHAWRGQDSNPQPTEVSPALTCQPRPLSQLSYLVPCAGLPPARRRYLPRLHSSADLPGRPTVATSGSRHGCSQAVLGGFLRVVLRLRVIHEPLSAPTTARRPQANSANAAPTRSRRGATQYSCSRKSVRTAPRYSPRCWCTSSCATP